MTATSFGDDEEYSVAGDETVVDAGGYL